MDATIGLVLALERAPGGPQSAEPPKRLTARTIDTFRIPGLTRDVVES